MIKSMTGFGRVEAENDKLRVITEVKSLNSKFLDISLKLPKLYSSREIEVRNLLAKILGRGKINLLVECQPKIINDDSQIINEDLLKTYYRKLKSLATELEDNNADLFRMAILMPDVLDTESVSDQDNENWMEIFKSVEEAARKCDDFRMEEGKRIDSELRTYIENIDNYLDEIEKLDPQRIEEIKKRIRTNLNDILPGIEIDENRFEQELIYYIEKLDISEEDIRLQSHLSHFLAELDSAQSNGKKLAFISQEIGREINTIGSKANYAAIQKFVISMKEELEKIKEQLLNIL